MVVGAGVVVVAGVVAVVGTVSTVDRSGSSFSPQPAIAIAAIAASAAATRRRPAFRFVIGVNVSDRAQARPRPDQRLWSMLLRARFPFSRFSFGGSGPICSEHDAPTQPLNRSSFASIHLRTFL